MIKLTLVTAENFNAIKVVLIEMINNNALAQNLLAPTVSGANTPQLIPDDTITFDELFPEHLNMDIILIQNDARIIGYFSIGSAVKNLLTVTVAYFRFDRSKQMKREAWEALKALAIKNGTISIAATCLTEEDEDFRLEEMGFRRCNILKQKKAKTSSWKRLDFGA